MTTNDTTTARDSAEYVLRRLREMWGQRLKGTDAHWLAKIEAMRAGGYTYQRILLKLAPGFGD